MRIAAIIIGVILIGLGVWIATGTMTYPSTSSAEALGLKVSATVHKPVPAPVGYAGIVIGGVLIVAGALKKPR